MAKCPDCGKDAQDTAIFCYHCGRKIRDEALSVNNQSQKTRSLWGTTLGLAFSFAGIGTWWLGHNTKILPELSPSDLANKLAINFVENLIGWFIILTLVLWLLGKITVRSHSIWSEANIIAIPIALIGVYLQSLNGIVYPQPGPIGDMLLLFFTFTYNYFIWFFSAALAILLARHIYILDNKF
jgi:hypothetical protein